MSFRAVGDCLALVGSFFSETELASAEQAAVFERRVAARLLHELAVATARDAVPWDWRRQDGLGDKTLLPKLKRLRQYFAPLSSWSPVIDVPTLGQITVRPSKVLKTPVVHIPIAFGIQLGQPLSVGVRLHCSAHEASEGCCLGVVVASASGRLDTSHKVYFAPSTGYCFQEYPANGPSMVTRVMSPLALEHGTEDVEAWVQVLADGGVCFLRRSQGQLESSGTLPRAALPACTSEYFVTARFKPEELETPMGLSIVYSDSTLPEGMPSTETCTEFSAVWHEMNRHFDERYL
eukprot:gnl/TRDRNA2_/TRDRNA2_82224_c0_seq1.p1 gnl/TRDRNA2_/TRDRNA2_82224_c0~~gnl/TRDRNA2_/TRDRNA2_82224_c0_seq1.p1  ORF type:complete len:299 (-),score=35.63 gnl/TRDRNA2_/TRDRNA2_82224_c0_seq1:179-1054(-)